MGRSEELTSAPPTAPLIRRDAWRFGAVVGVAGAVVMVVLILTSRRGELFRSDALYFRLVAEHPFGHAHFLAVHRPITGDAYRYGRVLYPFVAWVLAVGHAPWVRWTLPFVDVVSLGVAGTLAAELVARRGRDVSRGFVILLVPGVWLSVSIAFSEVFVLALILLLFVMVIDGRAPWAPYVVTALAFLARETAGVAALPLVVRAAWHRRWREVAWWAMTPLPLLGWWGWVRHRVGEWPPLDSSISRRGALSYPIGGIAHVIRAGASGGHWFSFAVAAVTVAGAVWVYRRAPWFPVSEAAALFALIVVCLGPNAYRYPGESIRVMTPAQALVLLGAAGRKSPTCGETSGKL